MDGRLLDGDMAGVLLSPWEWKVVSSLFPPEHASVVSRRHQEWSRQHRDCHPHREVLIGLAGSCLYGHMQKVYPCNPGSVFLFDAFEEHDNYYAPATDGVRHLWLHLVQDEIFYSVHHVRKGRIVAGLGAHDRLAAPDMEAVLRQSWSGPSTAVPASEAVRRMKIIAALANVAIRVLEMDSAPTRVVTNRESQSQMIESIQKHIQQTAGKGLSLDNLARLAGYSKFHFLRVFQKHTGQSVHDYTNVCRLKRVTELRRQGLIKKQIAEALGFSCLAAFSRWHREHGL